MTPEQKSKMNLSGLEKGRGLFKGTKGILKSNSDSFKKGCKPWTAGKKRPELSSEKHPLWRGDSVGYLALHSWLYRTFGQLKKCSRCKTTESKRFVWHNISGEYKRDITDWERLCAICHANEHKNWEARWHVS